MCCLEPARCEGTAAVVQGHSGVPQKRDAVSGSGNGVEVQDHQQWEFSGMFPQPPQWFVDQGAPHPRAMCLYVAASAHKLSARKIQIFFFFLNKLF